MKKRVVTIHVHNEATAQTIQASIADLDRDTAEAVIKAMHVEAYKLLETRARLRHFRRPVTVLSFDSNGNLIMKWEESGWMWGENSPERREPSAIVFEDARGRKAAVRVEISR
jgi:hypothetical protein